MCTSFKQLTNGDHVSRYKMSMRFLGMREMEVYGWCRQIMRMGRTMNYWSTIVTKPVKIEYSNQSVISMHQ